MNLTHFQPSPRLRPYVATFLLVESEAGACHKVLPDTGLALAFRLGGRVSCETLGRVTAVPAAALTGISTSVRRLTYAPRTATLLVKFTAVGAAACLPIALHEVRNQSIALDEVLAPALIQQLCARLAEAPSPQQCVALLETFLLGQLRAAPLPQPVRHLVQQIQASAGTARIGQLLAAQPISRDPLEKAFRRVVGTSPKQFAILVRLRETLKISSLVRNSIALAHAAGYFDQAHFIHNFNRLTGQMPMQFAADGPYW